MGKGSAPVVGYWYAMGLHFGLCSGPVDAVLQINGGDDAVAWQGNMTASGQFAISKPNLYGGEKKEGGIDGTAWLMMGEDSQAPNAYLQGVLGTPMPAFRGLCTLAFRGKVGAMTPYIKPWAFKLRKTKAGWRTPVWEPTLADIDVGGGVHGMNAAHLLYRCITDPETGLGKPDSALDLDKLLYAAQTLFNEKFGLCLRWSRSDVTGNFIGNVCNHVGGAWAEDPTTGKQYLKLYRGDYDINTCVVIDESNIVELTSYQPPALAGAVNEVTVTWHDPLTNKDANTAPVQNLGNVQAQGRVISQKTSYPGIPTADLANRAAARDLRATSSLPAKLQVKVNASVVVAKGDVLAFSWASLKISKMPMRVLDVDRGTPTDTAITLTCAQDVYAMPTQTYVVAQPGLWTPPNTTPAALAYQRLDEASYRDLATRMRPADLAVLDSSTRYVGALGAAPPGIVAYNFELATRVAGGPDFKQVAAGAFAPTGTLVNAMAAESGPTAVTLANGSRLDLVKLGSEVLIDDETMRVDALDPLTGAATLARGCVDAVPAMHAAGSRVWFTDGFTGADPTEYLPGENVYAKLLTRTSAGTLDVAAAPQLSVAVGHRSQRPYPPSAVTINGAAAPSSVMAPVVVSFGRRNRLTQADQLIDATTGDITPESGQTTTVQIVKNGGPVASDQPGITGAAAAAWSPPNNGSYYVKAWSTRDSLGSRQTWQTAPFDVVVPIIVTTSLPAGTVGAPYNGSVAATGGATGGYTYAVSPALPSGLSLNPATGSVTATSSPATDADYTFTATDTVGGSGSKTSHIVIA